MSQEYIITLTAVNRVGILSAVTIALAELEAELREASQTVVRGYFTMIFSAEFSRDIEASLIRDHLQDACRMFQLDITVNQSSGERDEKRILDARHYSLRLGGSNRKGVLRELSACISRRQVDIAGMHAVRTHGNEGFEMVMKIAIPADFNLDALISELNQVGQPFDMTAEANPYS